MDVPDPFHARYTNLRLLGTGGFGVVYRAWDGEMERDVALKLLNRDLSADPEWRKRFRHEATAASKLNHPNITIVFDRGEFHDWLYIAMEFVEGETLSKLIERRDPQSDPERVALLEQLCDGLHYAHQRHVVHRDIKPVNLMVREEHDPRGLRRTLKILDFGVAKALDTSQTATGAQLMFTPHYVAPEVIRGGDVDGRCDIFAVGAVTYELLSSTRAFDIAPSTNVFEFLQDINRKIVEEPHRPLVEVRPDIDPELGAIVDRALAKRPEDRYHDAGEMGRHLRRVRERLQESQPEASSATTIALDPALVAAVTAARHALETGDPDAAVVQLEAVLTAALTVRSRRFVERTLEQARERQLAKHAKDAVAGAIAAFQRGEHAQAIASLERFEPGDLVAGQLAQMRQAATLIDATERAVREAPAAARAAAVFQLDQFVPMDLTRPAAERLRARAIEKLAEEEHARALEEVRRTQEAIRCAREEFRAGRTDAAVAALAAMEPDPAIVAARKQFRDAQALILDATATIDHGACPERVRALDALAGFEDRELVSAALAHLQAIASARDADERRVEEDAARARVGAARVARRRRLTRVSAVCAVGVAVLLTIVALWAPRSAPVATTSREARASQPNGVVDSGRTPVTPSRPPEPTDTGSQEGPADVRSTVDAGTGATADSTTDADLQPVRERVRRQLAAGQLPQALATLERGLATASDDRELLNLLHRVVGSAADATSAARREAVDAGAPATAPTAFALGAQRQRSAERDRVAGRLPAAARGFWLARDAFAHATQEASHASASRAPTTSAAAPETRPPATPATNPPAPTLPPAAEPVPSKPATDRAKSSQPPQPPADAPRRANEVEGVRAALRAYEAAFEAMDVEALQRVQILSAEQVRRLRGAFAQSRAYAVDLVVHRIDLSKDGSQATVGGQVNQTFTPKAGGRQTISFPVTFGLEKRGDTWIIVSTKTE